MLIQDFVIIFGPNFGQKISPIPVEAEGGLTVISLVQREKFSRRKFHI